MSRRAQSSRSAILSLGAAVAAAVLTAQPAAALDPAGQYLYVPNRASSDVAVIDPATQQVIARIEVGKVPHQVAVSDRLGKLIASNTADNRSEEHTSELQSR